MPPLESVEFFEGSNGAGGLTLKIDPIDGPSSPGAGDLPGGLTGEKIHCRNKKRDNMQVRVSFNDYTIISYIH
jgi:hypothetical protein